MRIFGRISIRTMKGFVMEVEAVHVELLKLAASTLKGHERRAFVAEVALRLCEGKEWLADDRFGVRMLA
jgi:hypothetical protein